MSGIFLLGGAKAKGELKKIESIEYSGKCGCWVANLEQKKVAFKDTKPGEKDENGWYRTSHRNITETEGWNPQDCVGGSCREGELRFNSGTLGEYTAMTEDIKNALIKMDIKETLEKKGYGTWDLNVDAILKNLLADGHAAAAESAQKGPPEPTFPIPEAFHGIWSVHGRDGKLGIVTITANTFIRDNVPASVVAPPGPDSFIIEYANCTSRSTFEKQKNGKVVEHNNVNKNSYEYTLRSKLPKLGHVVQEEIPEMFHGVWLSPHSEFIVTIWANKFTRDNTDANKFKILGPDKIEVQFGNYTAIWTKQKKHDTVISEYNTIKKTEYKWTMLAALPELS